MHPFIEFSCWSYFVRVTFCFPHPIHVCPPCVVIKNQKIQIWIASSYFCATKHRWYIVDCTLFSSWTHRSVREPFVPIETCCARRTAHRIFGTPSFARVHCSCEVTVHVRALFTYEHCSYSVRVLPVIGREKTKTEPKKTKKHVKLLFTYCALFMIRTLFTSVILPWVPISKKKQRVWVVSSRPWKKKEKKTESVKKKEKKTNSATVLFSFVGALVYFCIWYCCSRTIILSNRMPSYTIFEH